MCSNLDVLDFTFDTNRFIFAQTWLALKKRRIEITVLSSVHLGSESCQIDALLAYLSSISPKILVLNGSFFEGQHQNESTFPSRHFRVLKKLCAMAATGTAIYYIHGKGDTFVRQIQDRSLGNVHFTKNLFLDLDGKKAWFTHGEFLGSSLLSNKWVQQLGSASYRTLARLIAARNSFLYKSSGPQKNLNKAGKSTIAPIAENPEKGKTAAKLAIDRGCDYVICGAPREFGRQWVETKKGKCQYLSAGDWMKNQTALEYNFKRWKPYYYSEDKLSPFFADEDLKEMGMEELLSKNLSPGPSPA